MRQFATVLVVLMVLLAGCGSAADSGTETTAADTESPVTTTAPGTADGTDASDGTATDDGTDDSEAVVKPADPPEDRLGWEGGYWYNETLDIDRSDGLNESELNAVVNRSMARVEKVRELEFERPVPVEIQTRSEFQNRSGGYNYSTADRLHQNVKWEAMLMVGEDTSAIATQQSNRGATVGGFYSPTEDRIVVVSENETSPKLDEITLAQELFHALQDQKYNFSNFRSQTQEGHNANDGIIEGDGNYVDYLYEQRCEEEWDCLMPRSSGGGGGSPDIHFGLYFVSFQPYSSGPGFVQELHEEQGWGAVNAVYENPPASSEQVIHPDKYGEDQPTEIDFEDRSNDEWEILEMGEGSVNYATFGEGGLASMVYYPTFEASQKNQAPTQVTVPYRAFFNYQGQELQPINPYNYSFEASAGWDGDRLYPYVNGSSAETNETGYVWQMEWDSEADAREFVSTYETILEHRGATAVEGHANTYRIPEGNEFSDAYYVQIEGTTVYIVNAPSVDDLDEVRSGAAPSN